MKERYLFRGKRVDNGEWVQGCYLGFERPFMYTDTGPVEVDSATVGQCTGLTDKHGALIFEGNICKCSLGRLFTVEWDSENGRFLGFKVGDKKDGSGTIMYVGREPKAENIGNIHDNPELLEEGR